MAKRKVTTICALALVVLIAARCGVDKVSKDTYNEYKDNLPSYGNEQIYDNNKQSNQENPPIENNQVQEFTYFEDAKTTLKTIAESEDWAKLKEKGKNYIITGIDFIFYDQPINGVYFSELSDSSKKAVINALTSIDSAIMEYHPNYKEEISAKYRVASEYLHEKYLKILDSIKEYLGQENFDELSDDINNTIDKIGEGYKEGYSFIKDKYEEWRNE